MAVDEIVDAELPACRIMTGVPPTVQQTTFGLGRELDHDVTAYTVLSGSSPVP